MYKKYFTQTEQAQVIAQYHEGATVEELACLWKAARGTMWSRLKKWGVQMRPMHRRKKADLPKGRAPRFSEEQHTEMVHLYTKVNKTMEELALIYSCSRDTIGYWLHKANVTIRKPGRRGRELISPEMIEQIAQDKASGKQWKELSRVYGYTVAYLSAVSGLRAREIRAQQTK